MSFFSKIASHDPVMRLLGGNNHNDHDGGHGGGLLFGYPMVPGETVSTIAHKLQIPIDELLSSNPSLKVDTPLTPGLDITLPTRNLDQIISNITHLSAPDAPLPPISRELPVAPTLPSGNLQMPTIPAANDIGNIDVRNPAAVVIGTNARNTSPASGIDTLASSYALTNGVQATPTQGMPIDRSNVTVITTPVTTASTPLSTSAAEEHAPTLSFSQAASTTIRAAQTPTQSQTNGELPPPPPMPPNGNIQTAPLVHAVPMEPAWTPPSAMPSAWNTVIEATDGNQAKLQILAMMAAQMEGAGVIGGTAATAQTPGFIDPQALAAYASNNMRAGRTIDLGAGRTLEFSLAPDPMRRVAAIGQEDRAATTGMRRTGDGLDQIPPEDGADPDEETQDSHPERQRERRRLAAVAAMRRRRRPLSTRCRYREGQRRPLHASGHGRYPKSVDLAEFRGRLPRRYLWTTSKRRDDQDSPDPE